MQARRRGNAARQGPSQTPCTLSRSTSARPTMSGGETARDCGGCPSNGNSTRRTPPTASPCNGQRRGGGTVYASKRRGSPPLPRGRSLRPVVGITSTFHPDSGDFQHTSGGHPHDSLQAGHHPAAVPTSQPYRTCHERRTSGNTTAGLMEEQHLAFIVKLAPPDHPMAEPPPLEPTLGGSQTSLETRPGPHTQRGHGRAPDDGRRLGGHHRSMG